VKTSSLAAAATLAAALMAVPGAALAANGPNSTANPNGSPVRLAYLKGRGDAEIQRRLTTLTADAALVSSATHLTSSDQQALSTLISNDQSGLSALKTKIDNDTSVQVATADVQSIVTAYRIYVLVDPKIHETIGADRALASAALFGPLAANLQTRINNGKNVDPAAQQALNDLNAKVAAAQAAASPVPGQVLPLDPSGYPGNKPILQAARQALETARDDLKAARTDAAKVVAYLH